MRKHALKLTSLIAVALAVTFLGPPRAAADDDDPPTRVARLSQAEGSVSFEPAGTEDWVTAVVNRPLTTGDKLWADQNSRAELHLGSASIRLGANTGFSFLNLDDRTAQLQLTEGTLRIRIRRPLGIPASDVVNGRLVVPDAPEKTRGHDFGGGFRWKLRAPLPLVRVFDRQAAAEAGRLHVEHAIGRAGIGREIGSADAPEEIAIGLGRTPQFS